MQPCHFRILFLTAVSLPHDQLWAILEGKASLITAFVQFKPEGHREPRNEFVSLSQVKCLVGLESGTFQL